MSRANPSDFTIAIARRLETAYQHLADRWFDELRELLTLPPDDIFPDHDDAARVLHARWRCTLMNSRTAGAEEVSDATNPLRDMGLCACGGTLRVR